MNLAEGSLDGDEPVFRSALQKIRDAAKANNLPIMGFGISPSTLQRRIEMGWNAFIIHGDIDAICISAAQSLKEYSSVVKEHRSVGEKNGERERNGRCGKNGKRDSKL